MVEFNLENESITESEETRSVFGASEDGNRAIQYLVDEKGWFHDERAAFRAALAYGAAKKISPTVGGKYKSKWNIGTLEQSGRIRTLLIEAGFTKDPYTLVNAIGDAALREMYEKAKAGYTLSSILFDS
jgi:hypothetical protein